MADLPNWLTAEFPEHDIEVTIRYDDGNFIADCPPGPVLYFSIDQAFDSVEAAGFAPVIDKSCDGHGVDVDGDFCFGNSEDGLHRLYMSGSRTSAGLQVIKDAYNYFLDLNEEYQNNPNDFVTAYNWLDNHPAFWTRQAAEKTFHWNTNELLGDVWTWVGREDGETFVALEFGGHVEPDYTERYHDTDLDVSAGTMEEAYIKLAAAVNKHFDISGNRLDNS